MSRHMTPERRAPHSPEDLDVYEHRSTDEEDATANRKDSAQSAASKASASDVATEDNRNENSHHIQSKMDNAKGRSDGEEEPLATPLEDSKDLEAADKEALVRPPLPLPASPTRSVSGAHPRNGIFWHLHFLDHTRRTPPDGSDNTAFRPGLEPDINGNADDTA